MYYNLTGLVVGLFHSWFHRIPCKWYQSCSRKLSKNCCLVSQKTIRLLSNENVKINRLEQRNETKDRQLNYKIPKQVGEQNQESTNLTQEESFKSGKVSFSCTACSTRRVTRLLCIGATQQSNQVWDNNCPEHFTSEVQNRH